MIFYAYQNTPKINQEATSILVKKMVSLALRAASTAQRALIWLHPSGLQRGLATQVATFEFKLLPGRVAGEG